MLLLNIAEESHLIPHMVINRIIGAAHQNIWPYAHALKALYTHLSWLGLHFARGLKIRNKSNLNDNGIFSAHVGLELSYSLQEWLALNIPYSSAYFNNRNSFLILRFSLIESILYLIGNMRNNLYSTAAVISPSLLVKNRPVYLASCNI